MQDRNNVNDYWYFKFYFAFYSFGRQDSNTHLYTLQTFSDNMRRNNQKFLVGV